MSIIFSDNFNSGSLTGWTSTIPLPSNLGTVRYWGVDNTYCAGCSALPHEAYKLLAAPIPNVGALRAQVTAYIADSQFDPPAEGMLCYAIVDFGGGVNVNRFNVLIYLRSDGSFNIRLNVGGFTTVFINTAGGLFPVDGTSFGLQIRFTVAQVVEIIFTVNDNDVATITHDKGSPYDANQWDEFFIYGNKTLLNGNSGPITALALTDNFEVDDSNAAVSWPRDASMATIDPAIACSGQPPPVTVGFCSTLTCTEIVACTIDFPLE